MPKRAPIVLSVLMILYWVVPYRAAVGAAGLSGGELWLSLGCGLILLGCGVTIRWHLRDRKFAERTRFAREHEGTDTLPP